MSEPPADTLVCALCIRKCWFSEIRFISFGAKFVELVRFPLCGFPLNDIMFYLQQQVNERAEVLH